MTAANIPTTPEGWLRLILAQPNFEAQLSVLEAAMKDGELRGVKEMAERADKAISRAFGN